MGPRQSVAAARLPEPMPARYRTHVRLRRRLALPSRGRMTATHSHPAPAAPTAADAPSEPFVHLHTHTEYSLLDGAARIGELVDTAKRMGQPAVAVTDHGVLYGAVEFTTAARKAGIQPIIGCEMYMAPRSRHDKEGKADRDPNHLVLIARDLTGYRNLVRLVSRSHLEGHYYKPRIDKQLLAEHAEGLICLSACIGGELPQAILRGDMNAAESVARQHMEIFGPDNYLLELQDHGIPEEVEIRAGLVEMARRTGLPLVCTNDSHYVRAEDAEPHDILLCLQTGARRQEEKRFRFHGPQFYMADGAEMTQRFAAYGEAASNTLAVARRCTLELPMGKTLLPRYSPIPEGLDADSYLRELCEQGLRERYPEPTREARERLAMELDVIRETGFAAYFLIVWDFIRAARCDGVKVGPGRGSAAGSLVAYVLRITNICPLRYGLIFERFLNRERVSMPDIDIDFDDRRRDRVIEYVQEKYGRDRVAQIITFGTMAARAAIRDVGRVLDVPLADVDRLAKLVPAQIGITLERALENRELREVYDNEPWARSIIDNARRLEGICRNASTHAAGVVIAPEPLENIVPLQRSTNDRDAMVTQFDMNGVQTIGLLKMDFLGLTNLSVIEATIENIRQTTGVELDIDTLPLDDPATYALLGRADTLGVFQLEAVGGKKILLDMQPQTLDDVSAASALNRPGPIEGGLIDLYMRRKRGEEPVEYVLPELEPILASTYGVIVYQDQVMKIASAVAGFTLGEADILRAAMGKKDKVKMALQREKFLAGAAGRGVDPRKAEELFDLMAYFAGYGFNKCLHKDTTVVDARTGERTTVGSLYERQRSFTVHGLGEDGRLRPRRVTDVMFNGRKTVYELRTAQGRRICATAAHRFRTLNGWRRLAELAPGDALATPRLLPVSSTETWPSEHLIVLAGLLSEGNTCHPSCLYYFNNDQRLIDDFVASAIKFSSTNVRIYRRSNGRLEVCLSSSRTETGMVSLSGAVDGSSALVVEDREPLRSGAYHWAAALGILGLRAERKHIPEPVFQLCDADLRLFLGRLWAGDGFIAGAGQFTPFYATSSRQLAVDVHTLLLRLGIVSGVHSKAFKYRETLRPGYTVHLVGEGSVRSFVEQVGVHCLGREKALDELRTFLGDVERGLTSKDTIPIEVRADVDRARLATGLTWTDLARRAGLSARCFRLADDPGRRRGYRRSTVARVAKVLGSSALADLASSDVFW
ncbi:MAG: polymerase subunit alpha, partial [Chloroflexota bacterium]|nr:polymerase subunit alpha [Chloroflexota bacterium]